MEKNYSIRPIDKSKLPQVFKLIEKLAEETKFFRPDYEIFSRTWSYYLDNNFGVIFGAFKDELIGLMSAIKSIDTNTGKLTACEMHWYVEPQHRKLGIGSELIMWVQEWAQLNHCKLFFMARPAGQPWMHKILEENRFRELEVFYIKEIA